MAKVEVVSVAKATGLSRLTLVLIIAENGLGVAAGLLESGGNPKRVKLARVLRAAEAGIREFLASPE